MVLKPNEVTYLKKGQKNLVEIREGDVRILRRNYCGVYELYREDEPAHTEYFEELNLFKNRYCKTKKKFSLYNISRQRLDIYPLIGYSSLRGLLKWFGEYGRIIYYDTKNFDGIEIDYYSWVSEMDNTVSNFQVVREGKKFTMNISVKNSNLMTA